MTTRAAYIASEVRNYAIIAIGVAFTLGCFALGCGGSL